MKMPECYVKEIKGIVENTENYNAAELFYAYTRLVTLKEYMLLECTNCADWLLKDENFDLLMTAFARTELKIAFFLHQYEEMKKMYQYRELRKRVTNNEGNS